LSGFLWSAANLLIAFVRRADETLFARRAHTSFGGASSDAPRADGNGYSMDAYRISSEPHYRATADEIALFEAAYRHRLPVMLKGRPAAARRASWSIWRGAFAGRS
jgi:hypothetical protein